MIGGNCANVQWRGFTCDNEFFIDYDVEKSALLASSHYFNKTYANELELVAGVTYRFTVRTGAANPILMSTMPDYQPVATVAARSVEPPDAVFQGPILFQADSSIPDVLYLTSPGATSIKLNINDVSKPNAATFAIVSAALAVIVASFL